MYNTPEADRLILREWWLEDAEDLYKYVCNPEAEPMAGWTPYSGRPYSLKFSSAIGKVEMSGLLRCEKTER